MTDSELDRIVVNMVRDYPISGRRCYWNYKARCLMVAYTGSPRPPTAMAYLADMSRQDGEELADRVRKSCQVLSAMMVETGATHAG